MIKKSKLTESPEDLEALSPEWKRELKRRVDDSLNPVRYAVFSDITGKGRWRLWLDVSSDCYGMSIEQATLFKCEHVAQAVAKAYSEKRRNDLLIAKLTPRNGKRQVLKYEKPNRRTMEAIPRIEAVQAISPTRLLVRFQNGEQRTYDCGALLSRPQFHLLTDPAFFRAVKVDTGGYGISWNDDIDLSEYELWTNGERVN